jgi:hypothetical protein
MAPTSATAMVTALASVCRSFMGLLPRTFASPAEAGDNDAPDPVAGTSEKAHFDARCNGAFARKPARSSGERP